MLLHDGGVQPFDAQSPEDLNIRRLLREIAAINRQTQGLKREKIRGPAIFH